MRKKPCDSSIWSTSPAIRSAPVAEDRAADLGAVRRPARSAPCGRTAAAATTAAGSSSAHSTLLTPKDDPERAGLTNTGYASRPGPVSSAPCRTTNSGVSIPALRGDGVGERLVHADRRARDVAADVRDAGQLQQTLHGPVLAGPAVQDGEHDVEADDSTSPCSTTSSPWASRSGEMTARSAGAVLPVRLGASQHVQTPRRRDARCRRARTARGRRCAATSIADFTETSCSSEEPPNRIATLQPFHRVTLLSKSRQFTRVCSTVSNRACSV